MFVGGLAAIGLYISLYFALLTYGLISSSRDVFVPNVCRLDEQSCASVVHTPAARLFAGIPNAVLGIGYYTVILVALLTDGWSRPGMLAALLLAGTISVVVGAYLIVQLYRVMRVSCPLCVATHVINLLLAVVIGLRLGALA